jgi:hypothetical protein
MAVSPWDVGNRQLRTPRGTSKITNQTSFRNNQQDATMYQNLLFQRFLLLNMYRATHRSSSGAQKLYLQPLVLHTSVVACRWQSDTLE